VEEDKSREDCKTPGFTTVEKLLAQSYKSMASELAENAGTTVKAGGFSRP
jgi:hypothetical protein